MTETSQKRGGWKLSLETRARMSAARKGETRGTFKKGHSTWNKGLKGFNQGHAPYYVKFGKDNLFYGEKHSPEAKLKMRIKKLVAIPVRTFADYDAKHAWMHQLFPKTGVCDFCEESKKTDWANVTDQYLYERSDWLELCRSCHRRFDYAKRRIISLNAVHG